MKNLVMDAHDQYEYNRVDFSVDQNDRITVMYFYTTTKGNETYGINEAKVMYKNKRLTMLEDFKVILGSGEEGTTDNDSPYKIIKYVEGNYTLQLTMRDNTLINVEMEKTR